MHRNWRCAALESARLECPQPTRSEIMAMPPATVNHGWIPAPPSLSQFRRGLDRVALETFPTEHTSQRAQHESIDLFTDGACLGPQDRMSRIASWGVVVSTPAGASDFKPVASGLLPGRYQSITRAELTAALSPSSLQPPQHVTLGCGLITSLWPRTFDTSQQAAIARSTALSPMTC